MSDLSLPPLEGSVVEKKFVTVAEMITQLQAFDENAVVVTHDCCYGYTFQPEAYVLDQPEDSYTKKDGERHHGVPSGATYIAID